MVRGPKPFCNHFTNPKGLLGPDDTIAFHVTVIPDHTDLTVPKMQHIYKFNHLSEYLRMYMNINSLGNEINSSWRHSPTGKIDVWYKFHIQHHSLFHSQYILKSQLIQADPCLDGLRESYGLNDVVLLSCGDSTCMYSFSL